MIGYRVPTETLTYKLDKERGQISMTEFDASKYAERNYQGRATQYDTKRFSSQIQQFWHSLDINIINELLGDEKELQLLEVACGTGRVTISLCSPRRKIYGSEFSGDMLSVAMEKTRENFRYDCTWLRANAVQLPFGDRTFDGLYTVRFLNLFSYSDVKIVCAELERVVKNDGVLVVHFSNALYAGGISMLRHWFGTYNKYLLWPSQIKKLFPHCRVETSRGTYLPFQGRLLPLLGEEKAAKISRWISRSFLKYFTHTTYFRVVKQS